MKKLFCFLTFVFTINNLLAQTENYTIAIERFQKDYNSGKYDAIFNSFSPEMKQEFPLEKTKAFLSGLKAQAGNIENKEFIKYQSTYASYKTEFERAVFEVNLSLDSQNTINGFFVKPYETPKETQTKTINALNTYPKEIAGIIYSKSKDFPNQTQLSIAVVKNGKTSYYGIIKENDSLKPVSTQNKVFEIGSLTKVFTSTVLASLVEKNKLKLTDYVNSYYPFSFKDNIRISFESLANHTSGLPRLPQNLDVSNNMSNPYKNYHSKELDEYLKNLMKLENEPSKVFSYSNLGTGLLGNTLGLSQKTSFLKLLQNIFDTYKMFHSFTSSENLGNTLIKGHNKNGDVVPNWDFDVLFGAGGILSTTEDLVKFANAQFDPKNKALALTRKPTFTVNDKIQMGLGWHIIKTTGDQELVWHNGGTGGYSSSMAINVNNRSAVIILSNVSEINDAVDSLCFELIKDPLKN
ncbi:MULTISPECIES: serine hydrolase [unclassified Chryseobacterium]|uniref:serine hydrolase n=1 Tax=unclassified Chryseobacterium TaxID=2593645 RepID=UPI000F4539D8|nr:serine hydrolase [Chryseobacterium sp. G0240]ROI01212.1 DUF3887 domain-containing protein [Chryseobacterium sp. G0240]